MLLEENLGGKFHDVAFGTDSQIWHQKHRQWKNRVQYQESEKAAQRMGEYIWIICLIND